MSASPGSLEVCQDCDFKNIVCPTDCFIYQDLKADYDYEMRMEDEVLEEGN